jgi:Tfp pilus tip-associated adhesin PilY1
MGGGMQEATVGTTANRAGSILVVGLEDGAYWHSPSNNLADADFAGTPTCIDADGDSYIDTCYILTTEADIYKVRFTNSDPSQGISLVKFFDGRDAASQVHQDNSNSILAYTKLVATFDSIGRLNLFFTTGNYEDMHDNTEQNYVFKVFDINPKEMPAADVTSTENLARTQDACDQVIPNSPFVDEGTRAGAGVLKLPLGEKVVFDPVLGGGAVLFTSYQPDANACGIGRSRLYGLNYRTCGAGLDTDNVPGEDTVATDYMAGQSTGVAQDPETGLVYIGSNAGSNDPTSGGLATFSTETKTNEKIDIPLLKLWWRQITP